MSAPTAPAASTAGSSTLCEPSVAHSATSISRRLVVALTGLVSMLWLVSTALALTIMHHELDRSLDSSLQEAAQRLLTLAAQNKVGAAGAAGIAQEPAEGRLIVPYDEYLTYQLRDASGRVLQHSHDAPAEPYSAPLAPGFADTEAFRVYTEGTVDGDLFIQVAETHDHRHEAIFEAGLGLAIADTILRQSGGRLVLVSPACGRTDGFEAIVDLQ